MFPPSETDRRRAIVLVHGAWVGEWSWFPILPGLRASGRAVHAVSLTGHGSRRHQGGPEVTLSDHVQDVCGLIETYDLEEITLVGHSYGGRVITQVCQRIAERIASLVFIDAHVPVAPDPGQPPERVATAEANGGMLPFTGYDPDPSWLSDPVAIKWFLDRIADQSFACFLEPWQAGLPTTVAKTYVFARGDQASRFAHYADVIRNDPAWTYRELAGPHFLMFSHPAQVAEIILDA